ncbi:CubicO group peptidase (beta-lactamase class C family) [Chitinophaga niastensis]|uniref:CubicO group peptidase (Beta-lactamase class C family) n=1 Tax=Chitinophaga niastensis TaxID=536980 RepID=A0A2P8HM65_CHINA|nr:serine hydrolase domain-containing protein [Chitinophaga niastensis]PSL47308.1 CubicO group peptidase (beta-lactamase class C family) [Chitinophaga niastensis]
MKSDIKKSILSILSAVSISLIATATQAQQKTTTGFDQQRLSRIDSFINREIKVQHIPGATALIIRNGEIVYNKAFGNADVATKKTMQLNNIFRIASQSKAITSLAAMMLWEENKFLLDDPLSKYIPAFKNPQVVVAFNAKDTTYTTRPANREITIRDLLRHTSGIAYPAVFSDPNMWAMYQKAGVPSGIGTSASTLQEKIAILAKLPLQHDPGAAFTYGLNTDILGYLVEIWSGQPLDVFLQKRIFEPLEMKDTYFHLPKEKQNRLVTLYENIGNTLLPVTHPIYEGVDPDFPKLHGTYLSGGAGLSSTIEDYAKFLTFYLNKGIYKNKRLISRKTIEYMLTNNLPEGTKSSPFPAQPDDIQFGLSGFSLETAKNDYLSPLSIGAFRWEGAFNTHGWVDPKENLIGLFFTQEYLSPYWRIGEEFKVLTYQAIND